MMGDDPQFFLEFGDWQRSVREALFDRTDLTVYSLFMHEISEICGESARVLGYIRDVGGRGDRGWKDRVLMALGFYDPLGEVRKRMERVIQRYRTIVPWQGG